MKQENIFQDKIKLSAGIIQMEFNMIQEYQNIIRRVRTLELEKSSVREDPDYHTTWQMMGVLYKFLENKYALKLKQKSEEDYEKLKGIMEKYENENDVDYLEFKFAANQIIKIMSICNFDDVLVKEEYDEDDYGFGEENEWIMGSLQRTSETCFLSMATT
jgi:hypothetical protein